MTKRQGPIFIQMKRSNLLRVIERDNVFENSGSSFKTVVSLKQMIDAPILRVTERDNVFENIGSSLKREWFENISIGWIILWMQLNIPEGNASRKSESAAAGDSTA